jgi:hypothetical protein
VFEAVIPAEMLKGLTDIDLVGIGALPGPMRKILGISEPFVEPSDFVGKTVGLQDSALAADTLKALGATPRGVPSSADLDGLDAYEQQLASIVGNRYYAEADYVTANVNLWPRALVIVMGTEAFEGLSSSHQNALRDATADAIPAALDDSRIEDEEAVVALCREDMTLTVASEDAIADLRAAVAPVYAELNSNSATRAHLAAIQELKDSLSRPAGSPKCPRSEAAASAGGAGFPQGAFLTTITEDDWDDWGDQTTKFAMVIDAETLKILDGGVGGEIGFNGTYTVFRDSIEVSDGVDTVTARWSFDGEWLRFSDVTPENSPFEIVWETHPWAKTG